MNDLETFIANSIKNIKDDRAATKTLLTNLMKYMMVTEERHEKVGMIAAKYVETLQRSNFTKAGIQTRRHYRQRKG